MGVLSVQRSRRLGHNWSDSTRLANLVGTLHILFIRPNKMNSLVIYLANRAGLIACTQGGDGSGEDLFYEFS
jgi:hypothetical protein